MYALEHPLVNRQGALLDDTPWNAIATLALGVAWVTIRRCWASSRGRPSASPGPRPLTGRCSAWRSPGPRPVSGATDRRRSRPRCCLAPPRARRKRCRAAGWRMWRCPRGRVAPAGLDRARAAPSGGAVAGGAIFGLGLGVHLLVSAWLTLGHHVRLWGPPASSPPGGPTILAPTSLGRSVLPGRALRARSPPVGLSRRGPLSAAASVVRYLADPLLPHSPEMIAGRPSTWPCSQSATAGSWRAREACCRPTPPGWRSLPCTDCSRRAERRSR